MEKETLSKKQLNLSILIENCINFNVLLFNEIKVKHINWEKENIKKIKKDIIKNNKNCLSNLIHYESSLMSNNVIDLVLECYREIEIMFIHVLNGQNLLFIQAAIENGKLFYQLPISLQKDYILYLIFNRYKLGKTKVSIQDEKIIKQYNYEINYLFEYHHFCKLMLIYAYQWSIENKELELTKKICKYREIVKSVAFLNACEKCDKKLIRKYLMDDLVNINIISKLGKTPLDIAILKFNQELIDLFLAQDKLDINYRGLGGNTALMTAVECGNYEAMKSLLDHKNIDINLSNDYGGTALMYATSNAVDNKENVHILVTKPDINLNLKDENEETALLLSIKCKNIKIAKYLINQKQIDINSKNIFGDCPLLLAIEYPNMHPLVDNLLKRNDIEVNIQNKNLSTPLMLAIQNNYKDIVKKLLAHPKINVNLKDSDGETALTISLKHGFFYISRLILQHPKLSCEDKENFYKRLTSPTPTESELLFSSLVEESDFIIASLIKYWFNCKTENEFQLKSWVDNYSEEKTKQLFQNIFHQQYKTSALTNHSLPSNQIKNKNLGVQMTTNTISKNEDSIKNRNKQDIENENIIKNKHKQNTQDTKNKNIIENKDKQDTENENMIKNKNKQDTENENMIKNKDKHDTKNNNNIMNNNQNTTNCNIEYLKYLKSKIQSFIIEQILNTQNTYGYSILMILVSVNDMENIKQILEYPFLNINLQDCYGETALIKAVNNDNSELVKILMESYHPTKNKTFNNQSQNIISSTSSPDTSKNSLTLQLSDLERLENISKDINIIHNQQIKYHIDTSLKDSNGYNAKKIAYIYGNKEIEKLIDDYNQLIINN